MRYYSAIRIEPEKHVQEICENPYLVFATDFMYYLAALNDVDWCPIETGSIHNSYTPHPLSPCTKNVKKAIEYNLDKSELCYQILYDELVPYDADNKLELFIFRIKNALDSLVDNPLSAFFTLLHAGKWSIQFYKCGTKDAAHLAPHLMSHALKGIVENSQLPTWLKTFDMIAQDLIELYKSGYSEGFYEEYFPYYEDLDVDEDEFDDGQFDEDEFDECKTCECGHCDDHFEDTEEGDDYAPNIYDEPESNDAESKESLEDFENEEIQD